MDAKRFYTNRIDTYLTFNNVFRKPQALRSFFEHSNYLNSDQHVLDAGCGAGAATFALLKALQHHGLTGQSVDAFDLTPAMLDRFRKRLAGRRFRMLKSERAMFWRLIGCLFPGRVMI